MDEGVAGYLTYTLLQDSAHQAEVEAWHERQMDMARRALAEGRWLKLRNISYAYDWNLTEADNPGLASAEAYVVVSYLMANYGMDKCIYTFIAVSHTSSVESAVFVNFGISLDQIEADVQTWLTATAAG